MAGRTETGRRDYRDTFAYRPDTDRPFENALAAARDGDRLDIEDAVALLTTGSDVVGIDQRRKELVLEAADRRRHERVGDGVTFVANLNNNVTTACNTGCLFCNFKDPATSFESNSTAESAGFTKPPARSHEIVDAALDRGISEVTSVSGLHPAFGLDDEHREALRAKDDPELVNFRPPEAYEVDPGTYVEQIEAMAIDGVHVHSMTPEEAAHATRGWDRTYRDVYRALAAAGLDSVPGTAAEILVDEVREVICPGKIDTAGWVAAMEAAADVGLDLTATIMYGHVENARHRAMHLEVIRDLQDRIGAITEFVPLSFVHANTPLYERGYVDGGATRDEDALLMAVSRLFLDNIDHLQSSWVKFGDDFGRTLLSCGADDFMGTVLSEEITKRAGGEHGEMRMVGEYVELISSIGRTPIERSTDYRTRRELDPDDRPHGPALGPRADGTPMFGA